MKDWVFYAFYIIYTFGFSTKAAQLRWKWNWPNYRFTTQSTFWCLLILKLTIEQSLRNSNLQETGEIIFNTLWLVQNYISPWGPGTNGPIWSRQYTNINGVPPSSHWGLSSTRSPNKRDMKAKVKLMTCLWSTGDGRCLYRGSIQHFSSYSKGKIMKGSYFWDWLAASFHLLLCWKGKRCASREQQVQSDRFKVSVHAK